MLRGQRTDRPGGTRQARAAERLKNIKAQWAAVGREIVFKHGGFPEFPVRSEKKFPVRSQAPPELVWKSP